MYIPLSWRLQEWFCPKCSLPTIDVAFLVRNWPEVGLKLFLLGSILLLAFSVFAFLLTAAMRKFVVDRSSKSTADRDSVLVERYFKEIDTAVDEIIKMAELVKRTNRKFAADWMHADIDLGSAGKPAELVNYFCHKTYDCIPKKEKKSALHAMNKDKVESNTLQSRLKSKSLRAKHGRSVKILLGPNKMCGETESARSTLSVQETSRAYLMSGLVQDIKEYLTSESVESRTRSDTLIGSPNLNMDKVSTERSRVSCNKVDEGHSEPKRQQIRHSLRSAERPTKDLIPNNNTCSPGDISNGRHSDVRPVRIQCFPMRSKYMPSREQTNENTRFEADFSKEHNQGCQRSGNFFLKAISCSESTIRNKSRCKRMLQRDSKSSSGAPKVKIEFNVRKHSSLKHKPPSRSYTKCRKRTRGHQTKRKHTTGCCWGARSARK